MSHKNWSQWTAGALLTGSVAGALIMLSIMGALQVPASAPRHAVELSESAVNRALKGDRSVAARMIRTIRLHQFDIRKGPIVDAKLAAGCEAFVSPLADVHLAHVARRCVS